MAARRGNRRGVTLGERSDAAAVPRQPSPSEWFAIWKLFDILSGLPGPEREKRLLAAGGSQLVIDEVQSLLQSSEENGFLDHGLELPDTGRLSGYASLPSGTMVGQFRILHLIGRGGTGEVYLAERVQGGFGQRVALKMLRPEAVTSTALFGLERGILADLEHPGIARLIDGGTADDGRPFMALEYVEGEAIDDWCESRRASLSQRLTLFLDVCEAVSYAHGRLVVHLDLKPTNVLVDRYGRVRLLDFGIARIVDEGNDLSRTKTLLTPDYAAPEQLENKPVSVATDVYSLGALLFKLLTGQGPWQSENATLSSLALRILRGDPAPPSWIPARCEGAPVPARSLAGDLDAIVLKAMRHAASGRYASVADLSTDVRRHLSFEPVQARSGSSTYRAQRFLRRNRVVVVAGVIVSVALLAAVTGISLKAREATAERDIAKEQSARQRAASQTMLIMLRDAYDEKKAKSTSVGDMMDTTTRNLVQSLPARSPDVAVRIETLADIYISSGNWQGARPLLLGAFARGIERTDPVGAARLKVKLAIVHLRDGNPAAAAALLDQAERVWRSAPDRFIKEIADTIDIKAYWLRDSGRTDQAVALLKEHQSDAERAYTLYFYNLPWRYSYQSMYLATLGRLDEADALLQRGQRIIEQGGDGSNGVTVVYMAQSEIAIQKREFARAESLIRRSVAIERRVNGRSLVLADYLSRDGQILTMMDRPNEALQALNEASHIARNFDSSSSRLNSKIDTAKIEALAKLGRLGEAEKLLQVATANLSDIPGRQLNQGLLLRARAVLRIAQGRLVEASSDIDAATAVFKRVAAPRALADITVLRANLDRLRVHGGSMPARATSAGVRSVR
ncbi:serine/threonine-protein kinase [Sphingomonas sp. HF-S4]|uniref:Serine/threonine-protein kinase n=1 Tax=Sphingomonas agrestis TaxID=3080540 RepID=A0ABU3Y376_9SPHN|nr:serine/threonine-protein kinase [Sphingomonas sp. HF-S4]MDV3455845.1 serine/threonine-protein kinase [Sphingomonas sp. HF-S4]